jgi:hypothetical protein
MTGEPSTDVVVGRFYAVSTDAVEEVRLELVERPLLGAVVEDGMILGPDVKVGTHAVLVHREPSGELLGRPVEPISLRDGGLCFDPSQGGVRTRENRRALGAFNAIVAEANSFGMVNAYAHVERAARTLNALLVSIGATPLPPVTVVVGAHFGSKLPGYAEGDGDRWARNLRPMSGGHYRLSARTTGVAEPFDVSPIGEIHLGPSRYRKPFAGSLAYLRNAAHNPAIIYHEYGHHLCRHTADFRLNAERLPADQRNGKTAIEEAVCDYVAAVLLDSGRPYGWYRADQGRRRDLDVRRHMSDIDETDDVHALGAPWAAALWRSRHELASRDLLASPAEHDLAVLAALANVGTIAGPGAGDRSRGKRERVRSRPRTFVRELSRALRDRGGRDASRATRQILEQHGIIAASEAATEPAAC